jgi:esterase/lipase
MDFDSCTIDFSDTDSGCFGGGGSALNQDELPWPPIFQNNCWVNDIDISGGNNSSSSNIASSFFSRGNLPLSSYATFMDACKREETIEELINQQNILKKEVVDLHRQNFVLEGEKEKLINDLINFGINDNTEMENVETQTYLDSTAAREEDAKKDALIEELEAKLFESQENCAKLEKENGEYSEKVFEMDIEKQRLNIKIHHYSQMNKNLEENNDDLEKEIKKVKDENEKLLEKLKKLEEKIERIEEGDFEHVSPPEEIILPSVDLS